MLTYPDIDPVAFSLGPLTVHWYGIMYIVAFTGAWYLARLRARRASAGGPVATARNGVPARHSTAGATAWSDEQIADLVFYGALGAVLGGRFGSVLFYNFDRFLGDPLWLLRVWEGGMSFHGGFLGVMLAFYFY